MPNASRRQKMVDDLDRMLDSIEEQPPEESSPETESSNAEPDGELNAWIWLIAFAMCPVAAVICARYADRAPEPVATRSVCEAGS